MNIPPVIHIILILIVCIMTTPLFLSFVKFQFQDTPILTTLSLWKICTGNECKSVHDKHFEITQISPDFDYIRLAFIIGYILIIISLVLSFYPPIKKYFFIPLLLGSILCLISPILLYMNIRYLEIKEQYWEEYDIGSYVQFVGSSLAIIFSIYLAFAKF